VRRLLACAGLLALGLAATPAGTSGDAELNWIIHERCILEHRGAPGPRGDKLVIVGTGPAWIRRDGRRIEILEHWGPPCRGGQPTVDNVDWIILKSSGSGEGVTVDASKGRFAPGATPERGTSEIEIRAYGEPITYRGTAHHDHIVLKTLGGRRAGLDLDAPAEGKRADVDMIVVGKRPQLLKIAGGRGPDLIDARGLVGYGGGAHALVLRGTAGDDTILGSRLSERRIEDGPGDDLVRAGGGKDFFWGGRGHDEIYGDGGADDLRYAVYRRYEQTFPDAADRIFGGRGNDRLDDRNGRHDVLRCGPGRDWVRRELFDHPGPDCELRTGPKSQPEKG